MEHPVLLVTDEKMERHDPGAGHVERPQRLAAIRAALEADPVGGARFVAPPAAEIENIQRVHDRPYVAALAALAGRSAQIEVDTRTSPGSWEAARLAAGAAEEAVRAVCSEDGTRAFALVRPPGHHAERDRAMGFCLVNNVALAAETAVHDFGCERVLIVDWDVHHGNGTQHTFEERSDVLFFSTHRYPFYPGTGAAEETGRGDGAGMTVNVPLPGGLGDADHLACFERLLLPIAERYRPDMVLVSAGFDSHRLDPLGGMEMTEGGFAALCDVVCEVADRHAGGRLALVLEGGYDLDGLAASVVAVTRVLAGGAAPASTAEPSEAAVRVIDRVRACHSATWTTD